MLENSLWKSSWKKLTAILIIISERLNAFPLRSGRRWSRRGREMGGEGGRGEGETYR
jgi:hypothetical protein